VTGSEAFGSGRVTGQRFRPGSISARHACECANLCYVHSYVADSGHWINSCTRIDMMGLCTWIPWESRGTRSRASLWSWWKLIPGLPLGWKTLYITSLWGPCLRNDLYCVEWDIKLYYTIPYRVRGMVWYGPDMVWYGMVFTLYLIHPCTTFDPWPVTLRLFTVAKVKTAKPLNSV